jgi:hypothetical protein
VDHHRLPAHPSLIRFPERKARKHLEAQVPDAELRNKLTPNYSLGCKRILLSDDYLPALIQPNVAVNTDGIRNVVGDEPVDAPTPRLASRMTSRSCARRSTRVEDERCPVHFDRTVLGRQLVAGISRGRGRVLVDCCGAHLILLPR